MPRLFAILLGCALTLASVGALGPARWSAPRAGSPTHVEGAGDARVAALEADIAALRAELSALRAQRADPSPPAAPAAPPQRHPTREEQVQSLEARLAEPVDPAWAARAEADLLRLYAPALDRDTGMQLIDLRCRRTLCRVEWSAAPDAEIRAVQDTPWDGTALYVQTDRLDGSRSLVAYIARSGEAW